LLHNDAKSTNNLGAAMSTRVEAEVALRASGDTPVGRERVRLLEAIRDTGSITAAAAALGVSYRTAWDSVHSLNNLFGDPLVAAKPGGRSGGGASITAAGAAVIEAYHLMQQEAAETLRRLQQNLGAGSKLVANMAWGMKMKTSARNLLHCKVVELIKGAVNCEVKLYCGGTDLLIAMISQHGAEQMRLAPGDEVYALINPSFVIVAREEGLGKSSARNCLRGEVVQREDGAVNSELVIAIGDSRTIAATITKESAGELDLKVGDRACALIKASHIVLLAPD
jgi:molybdate transport system regulatory protein